ncbi:MAG: diiron oxygenase [Acidimicrobiales bacterium]
MVEEDESGSTDDAGDAYVALLGRLSHQSVVKHFDAYADIDWDGPEFAIDPTDRRWELDDDDPLGHSGWYQDLVPEARARLGPSPATPTTRSSRRRSTR